ncbi:MAG: type II secretion system F family protein [Candidatus Omnitrophica bacterium]|nr:type II secretion system F family protein [Candidatus Omnitrophota bacterium]MBU1924943.1 type II secretion system F family protein [Candidatus Omnitrophota bacterium]
MPDFLYKARDSDGNLVQGTMVADNQNEIIDILQRRGLLITSIAELAQELKPRQIALRIKKRLTFGSGRVKTDDLCIFARQLGTLLNAGVPLLRSLGVLGKQVESNALRDAVERVKGDIQSGSTLRDALDKHPKVFSKFWVNLVGTGEASGQLPSVLEQIAQYFESSGQLQRKVVSALMYPAILVSVCVGAIFVFVIKIVPVFAEMFQSFGTELPALTQYIVNFSGLLRRFAFPLIVLSPVIIFLFVRFIRTSKGKLLFDALRLKLPVFGNLFRNIAIANFARGLGTMISSGVPILYALEIVTKTVGNRVIENSLEKVKESVRDGKTIAEPLEQSGIFPPMVVLMVNVGEETGELADMLKHVADFYEERIGTIVERLSSLLEPFLLVFMGSVVGFLVVAMFLPIFKLATSVNL